MKNEYGLFIGGSIERKTVELYECIYTSQSWGISACFMGLVREVVSEPESPTSYWCAEPRRILKNLASESLLWPLFIEAASAIDSAGVPLLTEAPDPPLRRMF